LVKLTKRTPSPTRKSIIIIIKRQEKLSHLSPKFGGKIDKISGSTTGNPVVKPLTTTKAGKSFGFAGLNSF